jgi:flagellar biosynthesis/type III secretory pathway protein FliH
VSPLVAASEPKGQGPRAEEAPSALGPRPSPLFRYRYPREDALKLLRFIDWLIRLPPPLELALRQELAELEEQTKMSYVTSWEQFAREEGVAEGRKEGRKEGEAHALLAQRL